MMRELRRYRLFLTFLLVPLFIVALIVILAINTVFSGGGEGDVSVETPPPAAPPAQAATPPPATEPPAVVPAPDPDPSTAAPGADPTAIPPVVPTPAPTPAPAPAPSVCDGSVHQVQSGDTLYAIAIDYGVTVDAIVDCNGLSDPGQIAEGQELKIPAPGAVVSEPAPDPSIVATVATGGAQLNVRDAPSLSNSQVVTQLADGESVQLTGQSQLADGVTWYETANGNWLHGDYLTLP